MRMRRVHTQSAILSILLALVVCLAACDYTVGAGTGTHDAGPPTTHGRYTPSAGTQAQAPTSATDGASPQPTRGDGTGARPSPTSILPTTSPPTSPPAPQCALFVTGEGTMSVENSFLNVESASGVEPLPQGAHVHWAGVLANMMIPLNGTLLANAGPIGVNGFVNLTCDQLKEATYGGGSVPVVNNEVFLVKTPSGRYAKVLISLVQGNPDPALRWQTDTP